MLKSTATFQMQIATEYNAHALSLGFQKKKGITFGIETNTWRWKYLPET